MVEKDQEKESECECFYCKNPVDLKKDRYTLLGDFEGEKEIEKTYFHFECFKTWYNKKVEEKARNTVKQFQDKAKGLFNGLKNIGLFGGTDTSSEKEDNKKKKSGGIFGFLNNLGGLDGMLNQNLDNKKEIPDIDDLLGGKEEKEENQEKSESEQAEKSESEKEKKENGSGKSEQSESEKRE